MWLALALGVAAVTTSVAAQSKNAGWLRDMRTAEAEARRLNRPLLIHFYADWCGPCKKMEGEALSSPDLMRQLGARFVGVKINTDQNRELAKQFNVESLPSDIIVAPDGKVLAHSVGYQAERDYLSRLARIDAKFTQSQKTMVASDGPDGAGAKPDVLKPIDTSPPPAARRSPGDAAFVGLNGYSPVALYHKRDWIKGKKENAAVYEGVVYYFVSADEAAEFDADPARFAPRILGCDPIVLQETERAIPGSTRFGAYFEERLFLFVGSATRDQFKQDPEKFGKVKQTVRVDQIEYRRGP